MKLLYALLLVALLGGCAKSAKEEAPVTFPNPDTISWLNAKKGPCGCHMTIYQGIYNNKPIIEVFGDDPKCNGINIVYKINGTELLNSGDASAYQAYRDNVKERKVLWTCP